MTRRVPRGRRHMERNIGAPNRRIPPDVQPKGSTSRDLDRRESDDDSAERKPVHPDSAAIVDHD